MSTDPNTDHNFNPAILDKLKQLQEKYAAMGQDLSSYLDGLLYADYRTYWDLIHLDTLLSLQHPQTPMPDEVVFIVYHQITELYFKLSLHEFERMTQEARENNGAVSEAFLLERVRRDLHGQLPRLRRRVARLRRDGDLQHREREVQCNYSKYLG